MGGSVSTDQRLLDAVLSLANDLCLSDVLRRVVEVSCELAGAKYGAMAVMGPNRKLLEFSAGDDPVHFPAEDPRSIRTADLPGFLGVPVLVRGEEFGHLYLAGKTEFTASDHEVVSAVATVAGVAIENATMFERARQREAWLRASTEVTTALLTGTSGREALCLVASRARAAAEGAVSALVLPDACGNLMLEVVDGGRGAQAEGLLLPSAAASYDVFATGEACRLDEPPPASAALVAEVDALGPAVLVPMPAGDRMLGVLVVARPHDQPPFDDADVELVEAFAAQAALVLEFTRVQGNAQRLAVLEDRDRIARDLHDLVIQRLFGLGLGLQGLDGLITRPLAATRIAKFVEEVDQTIREIRRTIFSLQEPPLSTSLRGQLLRTAQESAALLAFEPTVVLDGPLDSVVPDAMRPDLVATLREALTNVIRHAQARTVKVTVVVDPAVTRLVLVVRDDGRGLPDKTPEHTGGLVNMATRARRWNGECSVENAAKGGVRVYWSIPLREA